MSKRMFSINIVESDSFLDMPLTGQALYFHLSMYADNDGFVNPKRIVRMIGAAHDDLQILIAKGFCILFDSGVLVIKHWWINNTKRGDRHVPTTYQKEYAELYIKNNKSYTLDPLQRADLTEVKNLMTTKRQPNDNQRLPQYNTIQDKTMQLNAAQSNPIQSNSNSLRIFKKNKDLDKKVYAKAVQHDNDLGLKEKEARTRISTTGKKALSTTEIIFKENYK